MPNTYKIKNDGPPVAFQVRGGHEVVATGQTRTLELKEPLADEAIEQFKERGVAVSESSAKPENSVKEGRVGAPAPAKPAEDPAETGGVVPQSAKSERGGVDRAVTDTTTTTKPTTKHVGPVA